MAIHLPRCDLGSLRIFPNKLTKFELKVLFLTASFKQKKTLSENFCLFLFTVKIPNNSEIKAKEYAR